MEWRLAALTSASPSLYRNEYVSLPGLHSRAPVATSLAAGLLIAAAAYAYGGSAIGDDTFIYMRYVGHALAGSGFTYNVGEPSHGVTSSLWPFLMTPVAAVLGNSVTVWRVASIFLTAFAGAVFLSNSALASTAPPRPPF